MQLVTFVTNGDSRVGAHVDGHIVDVKAALAARLEAGGEGNAEKMAEALIPSDMRAFIGRGEPGLAQAKSAVDYALKQGVDGDAPGWERKIVYSLDEVGVHAPILNPEKIVAIGLNYSDHAKEAGMEPPKRPIFFSKYASSIVGPKGAVVLPPENVTNEVDYEVEFAVVIGKTAKNVSKEDAMDYVYGYTILNDISARDLQMQDQWVKGKALDTFAPIGPWIVTKDEIEDPHNLRLVMALNGKVVQDSTTANLIFDIPYLIEYLTTLFTLKPGDIIATGTPPGVGMARKPPLFLKPGDTMVAEVEGIGALENPVIR